MTAGTGDVTSTEVDGRVLRLTNPDRVLWPETGTRKRDLIDYYLAIAPVLLPHIAGRGLTLGRWPEGVDRTGWLQAECRGRPSWLAVHSVVARSGGRFDYCVVDSRPGLAWVANLGTIELHPFLALAERPGEPSAVVFDLDPGPPAGIVDAARVALEVRGRLAGLGLPAHVKTSGMLGVHVYVPLAPGHAFAATKAFARRVAHELAARDDRVTDRMARSLRPGRVYVDWVQNDPSRSTVAPYSARAAPLPLVSTPVLWDEIEAAVTTGDGRGLRFTTRDVLGRVDRMGDVFEPVLRGEAVLPPSV